MQVYCISAQIQAHLVLLSYQQCFFSSTVKPEANAPISRNVDVSGSSSPFRGLQPSGTFFTRPRRTLFPGCVRFDTRRRKECLALFARGVGQHMASDLTVKGPRCARDAATAQEQWRGSEWKAVHFRSSQALPSMRCDFFLPFAELLLFGKILDCEPVLHPPVTVHNAVPLSVTSAAGSGRMQRRRPAHRNGRNMKVLNRSGWFEEPQPKIGARPALPTTAWCGAVVVFLSF